MKNMQKWSKKLAANEKEETMTLKFQIRSLDKKKRQARDERWKIEFTLQWKF